MGRWEDESSIFRGIRFSVVTCVYCMWGGVVGDFERSNCRRVRR